MAGPGVAPVGGGRRAYPAGSAEVDSVELMGKMVSVDAGLLQTLLDIWSEENPHIGTSQDRSLSPQLCDCWPDYRRNSPWQKISQQYI